MRARVNDFSYDPDRAPIAAEWLALPERDKLRLVANFHTGLLKRFSGVKHHAALHVVVETQLANGFGPSKRAMVRLQQQGLTRHESIHAIAEVVSSCLGQSATGEGGGSGQAIQVRMNKALDELAAGAGRACVLNGEPESTPR